MLANRWASWELRTSDSTRTLSATDPDVRVVSQDPVGFVRDLKQQDGLSIWLCGGGRLAAALRDEIDELVMLARLSACRSLGRTR